jgi:glycosyltransferase involved in cell wall biosynthesis
MWIDDQTTVPASADGHQLELAATPIGPMPRAGLVAAWAQVELSAPPDLVPGRLARGKHLLRAAGELCADPPAARAAKVRERTARILAATRDVELFLAPSAFMADRMQAFGIPAERIVCSQNGVRVDLLSVVRRRRSEQMRFGYVGAVAPHKGVHILMNAYRSVLDRVGPEGAELRIYGNLTWFPDYVAQLREMSRGTNVQFLGEFDNRNVAHVYEQFDVLVVPSIWWENAPTTIYEAALTRTPVLASDIGAISNLVRPGLNGWLFRPGDAAHLAECMIAVVEGRTAVDALTYALPITSIATDAAQLERRYVDLFGNTVSASTPVAATP